jgi:hypothetical protein
MPRAVADRRGVAAAPGAKVGRRKSFGKGGIIGHRPADGQDVSVLLPRFTLAAIAFT